MATYSDSVVSAFRVQCSYRLHKRVGHDVSARKPCRWKGWSVDAVEKDGVLTCPRCGLDVAAVFRKKPDAET